MSKKSRRKAEASPKPEPPAAVEALKRRRNRRLMFVGLIALSFPLLEGIAYRFRAITMTIENRSNGPITGVKLTYSGGSIEEAEIKPGGSITRVTRPDFTFSGPEFSTYRLAIQFTTADGAMIRQSGRAGALDYSAHEKYLVEMVPVEGQVQIKHATSPGFPLGTIREILTGLGIG